MNSAAGSNGEAAASSDPLDGAQAEAKAKAKAKWPKVLDVGVSDVFSALAAGWRDFLAAPRFGLFFGGFYALGGWLLVLLLKYFQLPHLVYPLAMGFALVAPFVATGLYEVSRRLEEGAPLSASIIRLSCWNACGRDIAWMALVTGFTFVIWMDIAALLFFVFFGLTTSNPAEILTTIFTTQHGLIFLAIGNVVGAVLALAVFSFSVVSFPMLFHRDIDFVTAMVTSVGVVRKNFGAMIVWGLTIAVLLLLSFATALVGLIVILPVLGHASWHIYRRAVAPAAANGPGQGEMNTNGA